MSNALAIAAVTETIASLVTSGLDTSLVTGAQVTALPPDASGLPNPGVNIFLYQVAPNKAYRNADLPTRDAQGNLLRKPLAALDLYYLFTFYGDPTAREQERLLGAVALTLQANPTLPRSLIQSVQAATSFLTTSTLDAQPELIRFTPIVFSLEELSKLWSFLLKIDYVLSTAYVASVVLIETNDTIPGPALPVLGYNFTALPFATPVIAAVTASPDATKPILAGSNIAISGTNLAAGNGGVTQVLLNGTAAATSTVSAQQITLTLPGTLAAGTQTLQVTQPLQLGSPPVAHPGTGPNSTPFAFTLLPQVSAANAAAGPAVAVTLNPQVQAGQRVILVLTAQAAPNAVRLFDGGTQSATVSSLSIPVPGLASGSYGVQVLVDGAESPPGPVVTL
jgi:uncharacterized protein (TIGR03437 family)